MSDVQFNAVLVNLKRVLKRKKMTYRQLAESIGMSESGVKKLFSAGDCSMGKLLQICAVLEISFTSLIEQSSIDNYVEITFTPKQMTFFEENPQYFSFLSELVRHEYDLEHVSRVHSLDDRSQKHYLRKLYGMGLLQLNEQEEIVVPKRHGIERVGISEKLASKVQHGLQKDLLDKRWALPFESSSFSRKVLKEICRTRLSSGLKVTHQTALELHQSIEQILNDFVKKSVWEQTVHKPEELTEVSVLHVIAPYTPTYTVPQWR
jgi:DNA-binding Xre family transcriptional regulator